MSISKELNARLMENAEEQRVHVEYRSEYSYYSAVMEETGLTPAEYRKKNFRSLFFRNA